MYAFALPWSVSIGRCPGWYFVASEVLFVRNYGPALFTHTWSPALKEHFYLTLPFLRLRERVFPSRP
jgi:peptidoglycan/LPS O-acetylase OafA/YrhL